MPPSKGSGRSRTPPPSDSAVALQDHLHTLLNRLSSSVDVVRNWPPETGDASIHIKSTSRLIDSIRVVLKTIERVESVLKNNSQLRARLDACQVPIDLLDLLDHGGGLNPECFARGLLEEATGQLEGLKRRKSALERLGEAVNLGLQKKLNSNTAESDASRKRQDREDNEDDVKPPPAKKANTAQEASGTK